MYLLICYLEFFNFMSSMLHKLNNIRSLRALSREFSIDVLEEMLEKLRIVTEENVRSSSRQLSSRLNIRRK
nr:H-NS homolog stpA [Klebsiella pneumoniae]